MVYRDTGIGDAYLSTFTDAKYRNAAPPPGEFSTVTTGAIVRANVVVAITILTNGVRSEGLQRAYAVLQAMRAPETDE